MAKCQAWREGDFGITPYAYDRCYATKEIEICECLGNEAFCDFYPEKRKAATQPKFGEWISVKDRLPPDQGKKVLVFSHAAISGEWSSTPDAAQAREILNAYPGTVLLCANGHLHTDHFSVIDHIAYWDVNVVQNGGWRPHDGYHYAEDMTYDFQDYDEKGQPKGAPQSLPLNSMKQAKNTWFFREPLSAIVTVNENGEVKIEGSRTSWVYDIEPDWTESGMYPQISDHEITLDLPQ
jgi:hypothetical protein